MLRTFVTLLFLSPLCAAQDLAELQHLVHDAAVALKSPPDGVKQYAMPDFEVEVTAKNEFNAHADGSTNTIYISANLVRLFHRAPGELAAVIAHEVGHLQDPNCKARGAKIGLHDNALTRYCEEAADFIGMQYLMAAGFDSYEAAGALGRMLMASPDQTSVVAIMIGRFTSDHPVTVDRVKHLGEAAHQVCEDRPEICQR